LTDHAPTDPTRTMIHLDRLTKRFPGQERPAVDELTMDIPHGEIVILVGPSGCGKSTTLRLINRLIEPTSGRILLDGDDVTSTDADELRRRMGYVIQQIGLFPHQTIAQNIATVPRMLGWDKRRIAARVDELLETVNMDPAVFRGRYPKELSGGQAQRVGVARAMAADPPVLLMDEPFGAIDPITRDRLQNEFLRLQSEIRKTIVFVTHDIDEAIKLGDRMAVLKQGSVIAQYDTPERILTNPTDSYVETFIGAGATLKGLTLSQVRDVELADWPVAQEGAGRQAMLSMLRASDRDWVLMLDAERRPLRWYSARDLDSDAALKDVGLPASSIVGPNATLHDALDLMITSFTATVIVVDDRGAYQGVIELGAIHHRVVQVQAAARQRARLLDEMGAPDEAAQAR
jgi:osmoprotectant transport system ATP-binding protein